ncbi:MAG: hypothetical protein AAF125_02290 [Chloroflexota bacterium]
MSSNPRYAMVPPVMTVEVEDPMDIMIVRDTARRTAGLVGFNPAHRAQISSASATLAELVLKTGDAHTLRMSGIVHNNRRGIQVALTTPWLAGVSANNILVALRSKLGDLVDEIMLDDNDPKSPTILMVMWLSAERGKPSTEAGQ